MLSTRRVRTTGVPAIALLALIAALHARAVQFDAWTVEDGLPANSINDILQTRDGYLWLATPNGLARFDGVRFTVLDRSNGSGLDANRCVALAEDGDGTLWVATDIGVARCRGERCEPLTDAPGLPRRPVRSMSGDGAGRLWLRLDDEILELSNGAFHRVAPPPPLGRLETLWADNRAGVSETSSGVLRRFARGRLTGWTSAQGLPAEQVDWVAEDQRRVVWAATPAGLVALDDTGLRRIFSGIPGLAWRRPALHAATPIPVAPLLDRSGTLWLPGPDTWLGRVDGKSFERFPSPSGAQPVVQALFEDRQGNVWIATAGHGLLRARRQPITVLGTREGLAADDVRTVLETRAGALWIGTTRGVSRRQGERITGYGPDDGLAGEEITALHEDRAGNVWVGTIGGIRVFRDGRFVAPFPDIEASCRECGRFSALLVDRNGTLWIGTDAGPVARRHADGTFDVLLRKDGIAGGGVNAMIEDAKGVVWIGSRDGLTRVERGRATVFTERNGLPSNRIRALTEDGPSLWIATYDGGLARLRGGVFTHVSTPQGLFSSDISQVLPDGRGHLWLASNRGVYRISVKEFEEVAAGRRPALTSRPFGVRDGMRSAVCVGGRWPSGTRLRDGRLAFPTREGLAVVDPGAVPLDPEPPPVVIESATIDEKAAPIAGGLRIVPGQNALEIRYTALSLLDPEHIQFLYMLEGLDKEWTLAGPRRTAYYTHLPDGRFTFRVRARSSDGIASREDALLTVVVVPPFWRTPWFVLTSLAALVAVAALWHRARLARLERERARNEMFSRQLLAAQEEERKRIAAELHDSVGQSLAVIKNRALLGIAAPETSAAEHLREVADTSSHAIDEVREIAYGLRPHLLERLGLTRTLETLFRQAAASQGLELQVETESIDGLLTPEAEINVFRIAQESLSNTVKHADARSIRVATRRNGGRVEIEVSDDGRGFVPAEVKLSPGTSRGFGLVGMTERGRHVNADVTVASAPGRGTRVTVSLPVGRGTQESGAAPA